MQFFCPSWGYFGAKVSFFAETVLAFDEIVLEELSEVSNLPVIDGWNCARDIANHHKQPVLLSIFNPYR